MHIRKHIAATFVILYTAVYYLWLLLYDRNLILRIIVSDIFHTIPPTIVLAMLIKTYAKAIYAEKFFWFHLCISCGSFLAAQLSYDYYEIVLGIINPPLGWYSFLWVICVLFQATAIFLKFIEKTNDSSIWVLIIDTLTVMCIAFSVTLVCIILPGFPNVRIVNFADILYLAYPIGNLGCLFVSVNLYFSLKRNDPERKTLCLIALSFVVLFFANLIYSYMAITGTYHGGSLMDPLWPLYVLILGLASIEYNHMSREELQDLSDCLPNNYQDKAISFLPIISVVLLFIFMIFNRSKAVTIFSSISMILVTVRHVIIIIQNKYLISKLELLNNNLEGEVSARTKELYNMAYYDQLTILPNRRLFEMSLSTALIEADQNNTSTALMFLDLDRFKTINDTLGHSFGDLLLNEVGKRLESCLDSNCMLSRQGGDEFAIIVNKFDNKQYLENLAQKILTVLSKPMELNNHFAYISCSIGIAIYSLNNYDSETLMKHADSAMYRSKELGKNTYQFYDPVMDKLISKKLTLERELHKAIECNEFIIYYQPIVSTIDGRIIGAEALIRWMHPILGIVPPADFIPVAEETGMIDVIGQWVMKTSSMQAKKWHDQGFSHLKIAVNISPYQLQQNDFVPLVKRTLEETGLPPEYLDLEITENTPIQNSSEVITKLRILRDSGINISIDDFGTGFSSLGRLNKLPATTLKIAQQFVMDIESDTHSKTIISTIITGAKNMKLNIIAEGVENVYQLNYLKSLDCFEMQGFLFSKPIPAEIFEELLKNDKYLYYDTLKDIYQA